MDDHTAPRPPCSVVAINRSSATGDRDRSARARLIADIFAERFNPTLPPPDPDAIPRPGRHLRCTAETHGQVYVNGQVYHRDARARITVRSSGMPSGWSIRLAIVDVALVPLTPTNPGSRADPAVLRAHRQMADPAAAVALGTPLRNVFVGRPIHTDTHSLFSTAGLVFVREASVVVPLSEHKDEDGQLLRRLCAAATASLIGARRPDLDGRNRTTAPGAPTEANGDPPQLRRGHLRIIQ
jgi:hypothetical protein